MATVDDIEAPLTLEIDGSLVTPDKFVRAVTAFCKVLKELSPADEEGENTKLWRIQVKQGSNLIGAYPAVDVAPEIVAQVLRSMRQGVSLVESEAHEPPDFNRSALRSLRTLGKVSGVSPDDDTSIRIWVNKQPQPVTERTVANVSELLNTAYTEHGSIEGKLQTITERNGSKFVVYEPVWEQPIRCMIPDRLLPVAMKAFGRRVEVYGNVRYRSNGEPVSVFVETFDVMPDSEDLPGFMELRGVLQDRG